jgi:lipopolysaccharide export LptBFGC system permease protein LptF
MKIWERYLLLRLASTAGFILGSLFAVYVIIDLSIHSVRFFADGRANFGSVLLYYIHSFSMHLDLFFALAFLLSALKVLFDLTHHSELIALQMAGLSKRRLTRPLFMLAATLTVLSFANSQFLATDAQESIESFRFEHAKRKKEVVREHVHAVTLDDGSELIYQRFDPWQKRLIDAFWIKSPDEIWHLKIIELESTPLVGKLVDRLTRNNLGQMAVLESFDARALPELPLEPSAALVKFIPFENRPLATLILESFSKCADIEMIRAHLHYKLSMPLLPILIALAMPPVLLRFSRQTPTFLIASCSLFILIALLTVLDGMLILAENRVLSPAIAIWSPWIISLSGALRHFLKFS